MADTPFDPDYYDSPPGFPPENAVDVQTIGLSVATLPDNKVAVCLVTNQEQPPGFKTLMCACEYLMFIVAQNSGAGFEKALESLSGGAMTYKHLMVPENPPREKPGPG